MRVVLVGWWVHVAAYRGGGGDFRLWQPRHRPVQNNARIEELCRICASREGGTALVSGNKKGEDYTSVCDSSRYGQRNPSVEDKEIIFSLREKNRHIVRSHTTLGWVDYISLVLYLCTYLCVPLSFYILFSFLTWFCWFHYYRPSFSLLSLFPSSSYFFLLFSAFCLSP